MRWLGGVFRGEGFELRRCTAVYSAKCGSRAKALCGPHGVNVTLTSIGVNFGFTEGADVDAAVRALRAEACACVNPQDARWFEVTADAVCAGGVGARAHFASQGIRSER